MRRSRRYQGLLFGLCFALLALAAELAGGSLARRIDFGSHLRAAGYEHASYYPFLLAGVKVGAALMLAALAWRVSRARAAELAALRLLLAVGRRPHRAAPRLRLSLSLRLWAGMFALTSVIYLVQADSQSVSGGSWRLLGPWLHTSALPVFAVLSVGVAVVWRAVQEWLSEYENYAAATVAQAQRVESSAPPTIRPARAGAAAPRQLFGLAFECRPPPLPA